MLFFSDALELWPFGLGANKLLVSLAAHSARYWSAHHTWHTRFFNVLRVKHWYTGAFFLGRTSTYISFFNNFSWSEGGSNSQSLGRQSSVLPLSQIPSLPFRRSYLKVHETFIVRTLLNLIFLDVSNDNMFLKNRSAPVTVSMVAKWPPLSWKNKVIIRKI